MAAQRLKQKNLRILHGLPMIVHAIRKCLAAGIFDAVWVNADDQKFAELAAQENVCYHQRPVHLGSHAATSEDFVYEFLTCHPCEYLFQVHSIAPLLTHTQICDFVQYMITEECDALLSVVNEQIECVYDRKPINFVFHAKQNSQTLQPVQRITWSISGWRARTYITAYENKKCATYAGKIGYFPINRFAGHVIKTEEDLRIAEALMSCALHTA